MTGNVNNKLQKQKVENSVKQTTKRTGRNLFPKFQANTISYRPRALLIIKAY